MSTQAARDPAAFHELLDQLRHGDAGAARHFVEEYGRHVMRFVRRFRAHQLCSKFDVEDYVQDVWRCFFHKLPQLDFSHAHVLIAFLYRLSHNVVVERNVHFLQTQKSDVRREVSLHDPHLNTQALVSTEAPPGTRVDCRDEIDWLLRDVSCLGQEIARHIGEGHSQKETAHALQVAEKTVGRFMAQLRSRAAGP